MTGLLLPGQRQPEPGTGTLLSVNVGRARDLPGAGRSAIGKVAVDGPVRVATLGLDGDEQADRRHHGGVDKAVYAYAWETLRAWEALLERSLWPGALGENLTTLGIDVDGALLGEVWEVGTCLLEVRGPRTPCRKLSVAMDRPSLRREFLAAGRPGAYLAVLGEGVVRAGDAVHVVFRPTDAPSVAQVFRKSAGTRRRSAMPQPTPV